jgi:hypothetical protein
MLHLRLSCEQVSEGLEARQFASVITECRTMVRLVDETMLPKGSSE